MPKRVPQLKEQFSFSVCSGSDRSQLMLLEVPPERVTVMENWDKVLLEKFIRA